MKNIKECGPDWFPVWLKGKVLNCFFKEMCIEHDELYDLGGNGVSDYSSLHWATKASNISGAKGGGTNKIFWENDMVVTDDYTISA